MAISLSRFRLCPLNVRRKRCLLEEGARRRQWGGDEVSVLRMLWATRATGLSLVASSSSPVVSIHPSPVRTSFLDLPPYCRFRLLNFLRMDVPPEGRCVPFSSSIESGILGPLPSIKGQTGNHAVLQDGYHSYCRYGANYPIFTSHSSHDHRWWLSRRISGDSLGMLNSRRRSTNPVPYNALSLMRTRSNFKPTSAFHQEGNHKSPCTPERIEAADLLGDPPVPITLGSTCGLCQELLTDSSPVREELLTSTDVSVVAVLVCGHLYHADCLEGETSEAHKPDPPCPVCFLKSTDAV